MRKIQYNWLISIALLVSDSLIVSIANELASQVNELDLIEWSAGRATIGKSYAAVLCISEI